MILISTCFPTLHNLVWYEVYRKHPINNDLPWCGNINHCNINHAVQAGPSTTKYHLFLHVLHVLLTESSTWYYLEQYRYGAITGKYGTRLLLIIELGIRSNTGGEYDTYGNTFTPEKPDISGFWIYHIISVSSGICWDIGNISDISCDIMDISVYIGHIP